MLTNVRNVDSEWEYQVNGAAEMTFKTTDANGFHIKFANGNVISVQWNPGNYVDDRSGERGDHRESRTAEVAAWDANDNWIKLGENDDVVGWQSPNQVAAIIAQIAAMEPEA